MAGAATASVAVGGGATGGASTGKMVTPGDAAEPPGSCEAQAASSVRANARHDRVGSMTGAYVIEPDKLPRFPTTERD